MQYDIKTGFKQIYHRVNTATTSHPTISPLIKWQQKITKLGFKFAYA